jgi:hypothetical protein
MSLSSPVSRFLHVANGTATTRLIQAAGIGGAVSLWADPLTEGPVPAELTDEELADVRMRYLAGVAGEAAIVESLAHTSPPLLDRSAGPARGGALSGHVIVTEFGRDVLARRTDRVAACGFDRWLGGVHWQRGVNEWRWDDRRQQVTKG